MLCAVKFHSPGKFICYPWMYPHSVLRTRVNHRQILCQNRAGTTCQPTSWCGSLSPTQSYEQIFKLSIPMAFWYFRHSLGQSIKLLTMPGLYSSITFRTFPHFTLDFSILHDPEKSLQVHREMAWTPSCSGFWGRCTSPSCCSQWLTVKVLLARMSVTPDPLSSGAQTQTPPPWLSCLSHCHPHPFLSYASTCFTWCSTFFLLHNASLLSPLHDKGLGQGSFLFPTFLSSSPSSNCPSSSLPS